jgi:hypothetical protein
VALTGRLTPLEIYKTYSGLSYNHVLRAVKGGFYGPIMRNGRRYTVLADNVYAYHRSYDAPRALPNMDRDGRVIELGRRKPRYRRNFSETCEPVPELEETVPLLSWATVHQATACLTRAGLPNPDGDELESLRYALSHWVARLPYLEQRVVGPWPFESPDPRPPLLRPDDIRAVAV